MMFYRKATVMMLLATLVVLPGQADAAGFFSRTLSQSQETLTIENQIIGKGTIYKVVDGDTVWLNVSDPDIYQRFKDAANTSDKKEALKDAYSSVKMRIAGINTAESVHRDKKRNTAEGKAASNFLKGKASGEPASFACWDHGNYGRPICGVAVNGQDIGLMMISLGYSKYITQYGQHPYLHNKYKQASEK